MANSCPLTHRREAVAAGATVERPVTDQPGGRRAGWIVDPYGHRWNLSAQSAEAAAPQGRVGGYTITRSD